MYPSLPEICRNLIPVDKVDESKVIASIESENVGFYVENVYFSKFDVK